MAKQPHDDLTKRRRILLRMHDIHAKLMSALREKIAAQQLTLTDISHATNVSTGQLLPIIRGNTAVTGGKVLQGVAKFVGQVELGNELGALAQKLSGDRWRGVCLHPTCAIELAFDLAEDYARRDHATIGQVIYASVFGAHQTTVYHVLNWTFDGLRDISNTDTAREIRTLLMGEGLETMLAKAYRDAEREFHKQCDVLGVLVQQLRPRFTTKIKLARALGISYSVLHQTVRCRNMRYSKKTLDATILRAHQLLGTEVVDSSALSVDPILASPKPLTDALPAVDFYPLFSAQIAAVRACAHALTELTRYSIHLREHDELELARVILTLNKFVRSQTLQEAQSGVPITSDMLTHILPTFTRRKGIMR
ncbi:MAG: hypothetical protein AAB879_00700 [Patescibacteria group bacterium]